MNDLIQQAINTAIDTGTFTLQAVEGIRALRDEKAGLVKTVEQLRADLAAERKRAADLTDEVNRYKAREQSVTASKAAVRSREDACLKKEVENAGLKATADTIKWTFETLFRNTVVREAVNARVPVMIPGANGCTGYVTEHSESRVVERTEA